MNFKLVYYSILFLVIVSILQAFFMWQLHKTSIETKNSLSSSPFLRHSTILQEHGKYYDPQEEMTRVQREMNNLFRNSLFRKDFNSEGTRETYQIFEPHIDIVNGTTKYTLRVDLPGMHKENIHIELVENEVHLSGERKSDVRDVEDQNSFYRSERSFGQFARIVKIPGKISAKSVVAHYNNGVLTIELHKSTSAKDQFSTPIPIEISENF